MQGWQALKQAIGELEWSDYHEAPEPVSGIDISRIVGIVPLAKDVKSPADQNKPDTGNPSAMPERFFQIPGLIGDMVAFHREHAPRPRPELSLAASIALAGVACGRKIKTQSGIRPNAYVLGLAPSGSGKDQPRLDNASALAAANMSAYLGPESPSSDSALISDLNESPSMLLQIDEVSHFFASFKTEGSGSAHLKNIKKALLELVGAASNPSWSPKSWADRDRKKTIKHPNLVLFGTSTSAGFWNAVSTADAADGFLARMMVVEATEQYPRLRDTREAPVPQSVVDILTDWHQLQSTDFQLPGFCPEAIEVGFHSAAEDRIRSHSDGIEDRLNDDPVEMRAVWARASALAKRLSLIFAASRGPHGIEISLEDAEVAVLLANWSTRLVIRRVFTSVSENEADRDKKRVIEIIRRAGSITASELTRKTFWLKDSRSRSMLISELIEGEFIKSTKLETGKTGPSPMVYQILRA